MQKKKLASFVVVFIILIILCLGFHLYRQSLTTHLESSTKKTLHEITIQQKFNVDSSISSKITTLKNIADAFSYLSEDLSVILDILNTIKDKAGFHYLILTDAEGRGVLDDGSRIDISDQEYYKQVLENQVILGEPQTSLIDGVEVITMAASIIQDGKIAGILVGTFSIESLEELILPSFNGKSYSFVVNDQGEIMFSTRNDYTITYQNNILEAWKELKFDKEVTYERVANDITCSRAGTVNYGVGDTMRIAEYVPLNYNQWSIVVVVPSAVIASETTVIMKSTTWLIGMVILCCVLLVIYILWQRKQSAKVFENFASYDDFTGAPTLAKFKMETAKFIAENNDKKLLMVKFDIEQFKLINQILGDETGDAVIKNLAKALDKNTPGKYKRYARLHDDEFLVLHIYEKAEELLDIRDRFQIIFYELMGNDFQYDIRMISGHYYMTNDNCTNVEEAIEKANIAHRRAKQTGQEICIYDAEFMEQSLKQKEIEGRSKSALQNHEFKVYLQPKYEIKNTVVVGAEALVRWIGTDGKIRYPGEFIPLFEQNGFITKLDFYMFEQVCMIIQGWMKNGQTPVPVSVNFSRLHLFSPEFVQRLCAIADQYEIPHQLLEIELTESVMFDKESIMQDVLDELHDHGFVLSMDDFGAGYSSLGLLKNLPVDIVKIDRSFFSFNMDEMRGKIIIESIMQLARRLGIYTVAEGVEIKEHIDLLDEIGCDVVQGYYYAKPMPAEQFFDKNRSVTNDK